MNIIWNRTSRRGIENEDPKNVINEVVTFKYVVTEDGITVFAAALGKNYITPQIEKEIEQRVMAEINKTEQTEPAASDVDEKLLQKLPKKVQPLVEALYKDSEGYWIHLVPTHLFVSMDAHTEHALTLAELKSMCRQVNIKEA